MVNVMVSIASSQNDAAQSRVSNERVSFSHSKDLLASISHSVREMAPYVPRAASKSHSQYK